MAAEPKRLVLLRHGRTAWNASRRAQGHADVPLDETGLAQAGAAARAVKELRPTALVSSDLQRARQTAEVVAAACGLPVRYDERFREYALGDNRVGLTMAEYAAQHPAEHALLEAGRGSEVPGRETAADVLARWRPALAEVTDAMEPGEVRVVVAHGAAIRTALTDLLGWSVEARHDLAELDNCARVEVVGTPVEVGDRWLLAAYNATA